MIERYTIATNQNQIEERFGIKFTSSIQNRFNAGPTQLLPIITSQTQNWLNTSIGAQNLIFQKTNA